MRGQRWCDPITQQASRSQRAHSAQVRRRQVWGANQANYLLKQFDHSDEDWTCPQQWLILGCYKWLCLSLWRLSDGCLPCRYRKRWADQRSDCNVTGHPRCLEDQEYCRRSWEWFSRLGRFNPTWAKLRNFHASQSRFWGQLHSCVWKSVARCEQQDVWDLDDEVR